MKTAVFIEVGSIQRYIFSSNSLKENIGASYIVKKIFDDLKNFEHSYIGGGNALLYFRDEKAAIDEMKKWSRNLLKNYPGIVPVIVIEPEFDEKNYAISKSNIIRKALEYKNQYVPITSLSSTGFTANCSRTGLSCEIFSDNIGDYISSESYVKLKASIYAEQEITEKYKKVVGDKEFTSNLDELGGSEGEKDYIAVIHINGNGLEGKTTKINDEEELKNFSKQMKDAFENSFQKLLEQLLNDWENIRIELNIKDNLLPIRPIIIWEDDITFVCDARLGLYFTYYFIKYFEEQKICKNITASGGISIVKIKYPFYRAYKLSEELCANAKKVRKENGSNDSWFDFHILFGGLAGTLESIRKENYIATDNKCLYKRPYSINDIPKILLSIKQLKELPQSKIKQFRDVLYQGEIEAKEFIKELVYRNEKLPVFSHSDEAKKGFVNKETPYLDMIELMDFCPDFFIKEVWE